MIIAGLMAATSLLTANFGAGIFSTGDMEWASPAQVRELTLGGDGGIALTPDGALKYVQPGQARYIAGLGVPIEQPSRNKQTFNTLSPTTTDGWFMPNTAAPGSALTNIDAMASLYAAQSPSGAYIFRDLIDQGIMNGRVIRLKNASTTENLSFQCRGSTGGIGVRHSYSGYVYCAAGVASLVMNGGGGSSDPFSGAYWRRVSGSGTPLDQARQMVVLVQPGSEVWIIATQLEEGAIVTSPIAGGATRAEDLFEIAGRHILGGPCTIRVGLWLARRDGVRRQIMTLAGGRETLEVMRHEDNSLSGVQTDERWRAGVARFWGGDHCTVVLRLSPTGWAVGIGGLLGHNPFPAMTKVGSRLRLGAAADGSAPLNGWITSVEIEHEVEDGDLRLASGTMLSADVLDARRYVDDVAGNDSNDGRTPETAWRTLERVAASDDALAVPTRAHVFFRRGGEWAEELTPQNYATFTAYGNGDLPTIGDGQMQAVASAGMSAFRLENLRFKGANQRGCNFFGRGGIQISDVEVTDCGDLNDPFGIGIANRTNATTPANDFYVRRTLVRDIDARVTTGGAGDMIYVERIGGRIKIIGCDLQAPVGNAGDGFQVSSSHPALLGANAARVVLAATRIDQRSKPSPSRKGCSVIQAGHCDVVGNYFRAINFGLGVDSITSHVYLNTAEGARLENYSWAYGIGGDIDTDGADWHDNVAIDCSRGIAISGNGLVDLPDGSTRQPYRADLFLRRFRIKNCSTAIYVDRPSSGRIVDNDIIDCTVAVTDHTDAMTPPVGRLYSDLDIRYNRVRAM